MPRILPRLRLVLSEYSAVEGSGGTDGSAFTRVISITVTAELDGSPRFEETIVPLSFSLSLNGDTADLEDDYTTDLSPDAFLVIPQGATLSLSTEGTEASSLIVKLTLVQDRIDEGDAQTFTLIAADIAGTLARTSTVFTIVDDDTVGIVVMPEHAEPRRLRKGQTTEYSVVLTSQPTGEVTVNVASVMLEGSEVVPSGDVLIIPQQPSVHRRQLVCSAAGDGRCR